MRWQVAGYTVEEMYEAGYSCPAVAKAGFSCQELYEVGYTVPQLRSAKMTTEMVKALEPPVTLSPPSARLTGCPDGLCIECGVRSAGTDEACVCFHR